MVGGGGGREEDDGVSAAAVVQDRVVQQPRAPRQTTTPQNNNKDGESYHAKYSKDVLVLDLAHLAEARQNGGEPLRGFHLNRAECELVDVDFAHVAAAA